MARRGSPSGIGTTAAEMEATGRERLLEAALHQLDSDGREAISLRSLAAAAELGEEEVAAAYPDVDACLAAAYEQLVGRLGAAVQVGCSTGGLLPPVREVSWALRVRGGLEALLSELSDRPLAARTLTLNYPSLGPAQQARYQDLLESLGPLLRARWEMSGAEAELPEEVEMLAVGAAEAIVAAEIRAGRAEGLWRMGPDILFSLLAPYVGSHIAAEEMERARRDQASDGSP